MDMEITKLKIGRREFEFYKLRCSVCHKPFPSCGGKRVTCGDPECQKQRGIENSLARHKSLYTTKRLKCLYCRDFFTFKATPDNRRVTCGRPRCCKEHNRYIQRQAQADPAFKEKQRAYNRAFYAVLSAMHTELKSRAGIRARAGRPSTAKVMLTELERVAGIESTGGML